jgi:hypothetical protein
VKVERTYALILFFQSIMVSRVLKNITREKLRGVTSFHNTTIPFSDFCHVFGVQLNPKTRNEINQYYSQYLIKTVKFDTSIVDSVEPIQPVVKYSSWMNLGILSFNTEYESSFNFILTLFSLWFSFL